MNINVRTNISNEYQEIEIVINSPEMNEQVQKLENELITIKMKEFDKIIGMQGNDLFVINISDVIMFYSEEKSNFCKTKDGIYRIKEKLYYLEENLSKENFIRISNSAIININNVKCFNTSIIGKIVVKFEDGSEENVSRRRMSEIMKFLNGKV